MNVRETTATLTCMLLSALSICISQEYAQEHTQSAFLPLYTTKTHASLNVPVLHWLVGSASTVAADEWFVLLDKAWYPDYGGSSFHTFSDASEWLQRDKSDMHGKSTLPAGCFTAHGDRQT